MSKQKTFKYTGPFKMVCGPQSTPVCDDATGEPLKFATVEDVREAAALFGYSYWQSGKPRPDNAAYEQLILLNY